MTSQDNDFEARALTLAEAALERPDSERSNYIYAQAHGEPALQRRALKLLAEAENDEADDFATGGGATLLEGLARPERVGTYIIEDEIGRGGMGIVYLGRRDGVDFEHKAAIKLVSERHSDGKLTARLLSERRLLARLKHPHIAQFYDGGEAEDGRPYFIMEYVDGEPLQSFLKETQANLEDRLRIFSEICSGVAYAHHNLIIHRDLSSANILISKDGAAKIIDFGVSHTIGASSGAGPQLTLTRGFAAPERIRGEPATTLSDIYSLGIILKQLVSSENAPRKTDLEAIAAKASVDDPQERYQSVEGILRDLENYQAGKSVAAVEGGWRYGLSRFVGRRKLAVAAGSIGLAAIITAGVIATALYLRAETALRQVEIARTEADMRFEDVRQLANRMMFDIYNEIEFLPGASTAKIKLADAAQIYLTDLSAASSADADLKLETAQGFIRLAAIKGSPTEGARNETAEAVRHLASAEKLLADILANHPENIDARYELNRALNSRIDIAIFSERDLTTALKTAEKAIEILESPAAPKPLPFKLRSALLSSKGLQALAFNENQQDEEALAIAREIATAWIEIAAERPDDKNAIRRIAISQNNVGRQLIHMGEFRKSIGHYDRAVQAMKRLLDLDPENELYQRDIAYTYWRRAHGYARLREGAPSFEDFQSAVSWMEQIVAQDPDNQNHEEFLAVMKGETMLAHKYMGDYEKAEKVGLEYVRNTRVFAARRPDDANPKRDVWIAWTNLIGLYKDWDKTEAWCNALAEAKMIALELGALDQLTKQDLVRREQQEAALQQCQT